MSERGRILLIQPRHVYAPPVSAGMRGHVYMPTSLLTVAARILAAGCDATLCDENLRCCRFDASVVGVNLVGPPYIAPAIDLRERLRMVFEDEFCLVLGGQVVSGFSEGQLQRACGPGVMNGNQDEVLASALKITASELPPPLETSLIPAYELLSDEDMAIYLGQEFSFFLSEGCRYACTFCGAKRSHVDGGTGRASAVREGYRATEVVKRDLEYLVGRAKRCGVGRLRMYLSNLDLFQSPVKLGEFASVVASVRRENDDFPIDLRGLSTVRSFVRAHQLYPETIESMKRAGLERIGFGIDGSTARLWRATKKPNTKSECLEAIVVTRNVYGLTPETLMVFGHNDYDDGESMELAYQFSGDMQHAYGAIPRPHVAKNVIPGNDGWRAREHQEVVELLLSHPSLFQALDFTALPSRLTHPDNEFRALVTEYFIKVCELRSGPFAALTQYVKPEELGMTEEELREVRSFNEGKYDI